MTKEFFATDKFLVPDEDRLELTFCIPCMLVFLSEGVGKGKTDSRTAAAGRLERICEILEYSKTAAALVHCIWVDQYEALYVEFKTCASQHSTHKSQQKPEESQLGQLVEVVETQPVSVEKYEANPKIYNKRKRTSERGRHADEDLIPPSDLSTLAVQGPNNPAISTVQSQRYKDATQQCDDETSQSCQEFSTESQLQAIREPLRLRSPAPHQDLLIAETLMRDVKIYFENTCRTMKFDDQGTLLNLEGTEFHNDLCSNFDSYCFSATKFKEKRSFVDFRVAFDKAFSLVQPILEAEHPRTLACFLEVMIHFIQVGMPAAASTILRFIQQMSVIRKKQSFARLSWILADLKSNSLLAMAQIWKCVVDTVESELGPRSRFAISVRLDYIKRVYGHSEYREEERLLREVLTQLSSSPSVSSPRVMLNLAHNLNRQRRHKEAEEIALGVLSLFGEHDMYRGRKVERVECKKVISHCQFYRGKILAAQQTMQEAIQMVESFWGPHHSWILEFKNVLEGWYRQSGMVESANFLRR